MGANRVARRLGKFCLSLVMVATLLPTTVLPAVPRQEAGKPDFVAAKAGTASLDSRLARLAATASERGAAEAKTFGQTRQLDTDGKFVTVIVTAGGGQSGKATAAVRGAGGEVSGVYEDKLQARVPLSRLDALSKSPSVRSVMPPVRFKTSVVSQGVIETNASVRQGNGNTGAGTKIGIIDLGFAGLDSRLGTELPAVVNRWNEGILGVEGNGSETHGTAVAEIAHDMAPGATLYLAQIESEVELGLAKDWMVANGVKIINMSLVSVASDPMDGTGFTNGIIDSAVQQGVFWANAAGNERENHWRGDWVDANGDDLLEFVPGDDDQSFSGSAGDYVGAALTWKDSWGNASQDFDLVLWYWDGSSWSVVDFSQNYQNGSEGCVPSELLVVQLPWSGQYGWSIAKYSATATDVDFDFFDLVDPLEHQTHAYSLANPADNKSSGFMAVGALGRAPGYAQEYYSSEGPTRDGRVAPEIAAPSSVSSSVYGSFSGTSASSPHLAGAAALLREWNPSYTPAQIETYFRTNARDAGGTAGPDNRIGYGRLWLPYSDPNAVELPSSPVPGTLVGDVVRNSYEVELKKSDDLKLNLTRTSGDVGIALEVVDPSGASLTQGEMTAAVTAAETGVYTVRVYKTVADASEVSYSLAWQHIKATNLALSVSPAVTNYGGSTTVAATLKDSWDDARVGVVDFQRSYDNKSWTSYKKLSTAGNGTSSFSYVPTRKTYWRAQFTGTASLLKGSTSPSRSVAPKVYLTAPSVSSSTISNGATFSATGYLKPRHTAGTYPVKVLVYHYEKKSDGSYGYVYKTSFSAKASDYSTYTKYSASIKLPAAGKWRLRAFRVGDSTYAETFSGSKDVTVKGTTLSFTAPSTSSYASAKVYGYLKYADATGTMKALASKSVAIQQYTSGAWKTIATVTTSSTGRWSYTLKPTKKTTYRVRYAGSSTYLAQTSVKRAILPKVYLSTPSLGGKTKLALGTTYKATGYLKPRHSAGSYPVKIKAYRYESGKYVYKKTYSAKASDYSSYSKYTASIKLPSGGKWRLRAYHAADSKNAKTYSSYRYVTVNPTTLSITSDRTTATYGRSVKLTGTLRNMAGKGMAGKTVILEKSSNGTDWSYKKTLTTSSTGKLSVSVKPTSNTYYRFRYKGSSTYAPSTSSKKLVKSRQIELSGYGDATRSVYLVSGKALLGTVFESYYLGVLIYGPDGTLVAKGDFYDTDYSVHGGEFMAPVSGYYKIRVFTSEEWVMMIK